MLIQVTLAYVHVGSYPFNQSFLELLPGVAFVWIINHCLATTILFCM